MKYYDVIIVGAGLAGLQTARLLGKNGLAVLLVDRKKSLKQKIHTTGIFVRRTLEDFAIPEDCLGPPIRDVRLYSPARRSMNVASPHDEFRIGRMGHLYSRFLDHSLRHGVDWMPQTQYAGHYAVKNELVVRLNGASFSRWVRTRYLIGADGANSRVAPGLRLDLNREWIIGLEEVLAGVPLAGPPCLHCFVDPDLAPGYLAWLAQDGEETHIGVGGYPGAFDPHRALEKFRRSLSRTVNLDGARTIENRAGRIPIGGVLRNLANTSGLLVGDAAGAVSPLTAGGLDACMRLSTLAARVTTEYLSTQDPEVLTEYSGRLFRARFTSRLWMRRLLNIATHRQFAEFALMVLRLPGCRNLVSHVFFGRGSFPDMKEKLSDQPAF